jgi:serine/threonine-protein kinase
VPDPVDATADTELLARVERALAPQYEVEGELGRGGMGIVYRARDTRLKRSVAVKLLPPELAYRTEIKSRFLREAEMSAQLAHPNIVPIYSVDEKDGLVYFIMACVEGDNLGKRMAAQGLMPVAEVRRILREVSGALAFAHARKFIHRDIKPDNILIDKDDGRAIVTDFGIARAVQDGAETRLTATGIAIGTPAYMSPEQAAGDREIDGRADLYALGTLGYQMLAGRLPFEANSTAALLVAEPALLVTVTA